MIEEDIRGYGMNETLHLPHITSYSQDNMGEGFVSNSYLLPYLTTLLEQMKHSGRIDYEVVYQAIKGSYNTGMKIWLKNL